MLADQDVDRHLLRAGTRLLLPVLVDGWSEIYCYRSQQSGYLAG